MVLRSLLAAPLALACLFSSQALYASPASSFTPVHAMFAKSKTVKFDLRNSSSSAMELRAGETVIKLEAGKTVTVNLLPGTRIVTTTETSRHPAGTLIIEVYSSLDGSTINLS